MEVRLTTKEGKGGNSLQSVRCFVSRASDKSLPPVHTDQCVVLPHSTWCPVSVCHVLGTTVTANPDNVEHMLATNFNNFPKGKPFSSILGDLLGKGIFNVDGDLWMFQRKMASLELGSVSVRSYARSPCHEESVPRRAIGQVDALADEVIRQRRKLGPSSSNSDLLSRFMGSVDDDRYLRDIVVSFLLAGRDTVASGLTTLILLLSDHPEVVAKMRREIHANLKGNSMSYEALRFPQTSSRTVPRDDVLPDGTFVSKGGRVTYHPYAMGRMESIWGEDWAEFRPERWLSESGSFVPVGPFKYPVFQGGARVCLGKEMLWIMESSSSTHRGLMCYCGRRAILSRSGTKTNPGRLFLGCANWKVNNCGFFKWVSDEEEFEGSKAGLVQTKQSSVMSQVSSAVSIGEMRERRKIEIDIMDLLKLAVFVLLIGIFLGFVYFMAL
ncbi:cytochrome P450 94C1-like [Asparagus officinalis]|uniref:cytochrome P450 94C1-like n=1 Tax=Asparagus officinalis TaxID=4686 RepID=UPI00098E5057|nr:cytochrome P450 94C1-like [Asparagus officinalis]